jgi:hypothetical protein
MAGPIDKPSSAHPTPATADPISTLRFSGRRIADDNLWLVLNNGRLTAAVFANAEKI